MKRIPLTSLISISTMLGAATLLISACNETPASPMSAAGGSSQTAQGGSSQNNQGGSSQTTGQGGSSQTSGQGGSSTGQGGSSTGQGGSSTGQGGSSTGQGGSSTGQGGSSTGKGGSSTGQGGSSTGQGGNSTGQGGSSQTSKGGSSNVGGSSTGSTTATGGKATGGSSTTATGGRSSGGSTAAGGSTSTATGGGTSTSTCTTTEEQKFSFFLVSKKALQTDSGQTDGYGGNLKGITGADAICQRVAEKSSPCQKSKTWRAFLSTSSVNAKDRIGTGPWYDRRARLLAQNMTNLIAERPVGADSAIINDFPNEDGVPNHAPDGTQVDNHEILTGTGTDGNLYKQTGSGSPGSATGCGPKNEETWSADAATCWGWTSAEAKGCPRVGHSWPRDMSGKHWISVWNEGGCLPGGVDTDGMIGGLDGTRRVGSAGGYGGFYCFAVTGN